MYTEDDKDVSLKKNNSNNDNDFYTSFSEMTDDDKDKKSKKKKETKKKEVKVKEESDYSNFYGEEETDINNDNDNKKGKLIKIAIIVLLAIILIALIIVLIFGRSTPKGDIELTKTEYSLKIGETDYISYKIVDTESDVTSKFSSSDTNVIMVDDNGQIVAVGAGEATITIKYTINGNTKEKTCKVIVNYGSDVDQNITLNLIFESGNNDKWTNKDVVINVEANSIFGISSLKYAVNCDTECNYMDLEGTKITISNSGITNLKVIATDKKNQTSMKEVKIKIDKEAPSATYSGEKNIVSNSDVEVCATCSDSLSGCSKEKVCKKFTSSKSNQTITVSDNAGNTKNSSSFNVTINKKEDPCKLSVSSDGTVTATLREEATYYGFNSSYSGTNEKTKKVEINAYKSGESGAKVIQYYVLNKNGSGGSCYITVIKECNCTDSNSTDPNCPVTCKYRAN